MACVPWSPRQGSGEGARGQTWSPGGREEDENSSSSRLTKSGRDAKEDAVVQGGAQEVHSEEVAGELSREGRPGGAHLHTCTKESQTSSAEHRATESLHLESRRNGRSAAGLGAAALDTGFAEQGRQQRG